MYFFFHAKHPENDTQVALKDFNLDLTATSRPMGVLLKRIPSNKHHFTLALRMTGIWV